MTSQPVHLCCVEGCEKKATHERDYSIDDGTDQFEVAAGFCCEHVDMLASDSQPILDLEIKGVIREAKQV